MSDEDIKIDLTLDASAAVNSVNYLDLRMAQFIKKGGSGLNSLDTRIRHLNTSANNLSNTFAKSRFSNSVLDKYAQGTGKYGQAFSKVKTEAAATEQIVGRINTRMQAGLASKLAEYNVYKQTRDVAEEIYQIERQIDRDRELERYTGMTLDPDRMNRAELMREKDRLDTLANTRYALYDAAKTYLALAAAISAPGIAVVKFSADYQKALTSVRRVSGLAGDDFRTLALGLIDLTTEMPVTIQEMSRIATIGGQLGVAAANLADFTGVVAMFASTTNVSAEQTAMGLGRIAQLTQTTGSAYENLGSAIYQVGVTSVATEQEIIDLGSEIATSGNLAGFANHEIIGLAGSLASLGVQPEAARGSLMRIFDTITRGAADGGKALENIARISGMTAEEIQQQWGNNSQRVFTAFVEGLGAAQDAGQNTNAMLKDLGIYAVRDIRTLQILANNTELYADLLDQSNRAYASGNALREGFAVQIQNIADKFQMLTQTLSAISAEAGETMLPLLSKVIDGLTALAKSALEFTRTPLGSNLVALGAVLSVVVGSLLTYQGVMFLLKASIAALTTSAGGLRIANEGLSGSFVKLIGKLFEAGRAMTTAGVASKKLTADLVGTAVAAEGAAAGINTANASNAAFMRNLKGAGWLLAVSLAITAIAVAVDAVGDAMGDNKTKATEFFGDLESAVKQDTETWQKTGESIGLFTEQVELSKESLSAGASELNRYTKGQLNLETAIKNTTTATREQTIATGEAARAAVANNLAANQEFMNFYTKYQSQLKQAGFSLSTYIDQLLKGTGAEYLDPIIAKLREMARASVEFKTSATGITGGITPEMSELLRTIDSLAGATNGFNAQIEEMANKQMLLADAGIEAAKPMDELEDDMGALTKRVTEFSKALDSTLQVADVFDSIGEAIVDNGVAFDEFSKGGRDNLKVLQDAVGTLAETAGDDGAEFAANLGGMLATLEEQGANAYGEIDWLRDLMNQTFGVAWGLDFTSAPARADIRAFIESAIAALEMRAALERATLANMQAANAKGGYADTTTQTKKLTATENELAALKNFQIGLNKSYRDSQASVTDAKKRDTDATKKNTGANKANAKAARTMTDYIRDLSSVVNSAFDFRFGVDQAMRKLRDIQNDFKVFEIFEDIFDDRMFAATGVEEAFDSVADAVMSMRDEFEKAADDVEDAAQKIMDTLAALSDNAANRQIADYRLDVAELYGDELRATQIRAEIEKLDAERIDLQRDLSDAYTEQAEAQDATSRSLTGTSAAAIRNRKNIKKLLSEYLDYIEAISDSADPHTNLSEVIGSARDDFMAEATALGFSAGELSKYAAVLQPLTNEQRLQSGASDNAAESMEKLTEAWQDYIIELVESNAPMSVIKKAMKDAKTDISAQATALGMSRSEMQKYVGAIDDLQIAINKIPKKLTVDADLSPINRALEEWRKKNTGGKGLGSGVNIPITTSIAPADKRAMEKLRLQSLYLGYAKSYSKTGSDAAKNNMQYYYDKWKNYWSGGFTGAGGKYEPAGVVHKGEFVFPQNMVNQSTGLPYLDAFARVARGYQGGGYVTPSRSTAVTSPRPQIVELSPTDRMLLAAAGNVEILLDGRVVAQSVNKHNQTSTIRGNR